MATEKLPPHDFEAEEAVIGSLLVDPEAIFKASLLLKGKDFYSDKNRWLYEACFSLYDRSEVINEVTVAEELAHQGKLEEIGGVGYLSQLISRTPTSVGIESYAQIVHRLAIMRQLIDAAGQIAAIGYEAGPDVDATLDKAEEILFRLRRGESPRDFVHIRQVLGEYFEESGLTAPREGHLPHVLTGFTALDELLGGLQRSDLVILAARPSLGKSSLALGIARNAAIEQGAHIAIFSLEMAKEQLVQRLLSAESEVDSKRVRLGLFTEAEERKIMEAAGILSEAPIYVDDSPGLRVVDMRSKARRLHYEKNIDLLIVDYLQLIRGSGNGRMENRVQEMTEISRSLKSLARELDIPVVAVSQLSRAVEARTPHIPLLSDLRESGSIEQDADVVSFIYRDDVYYNEEEWYKRNPDKPYPKGIANIIVAKHRNGPTGQIDLWFTQKTTKFVNLEREEKEGEQPTLPRFS